MAQAAIGSNGIKNNSLKSADIKDNALTSADIKNDSLTSNDVKANSLKAADLAANSVGSSEITNSSVASGDIKNGTVASGDLANGSVTANKLAPGAVAFPNALWGTMLRNQTGAAESGFQVGPTGQPLGDGSLRLFVAGTSDVAAFGNSFDFARFQLEDITDISYATYNADDPPLVRPSLRIEIDPHLVADDTAGGLTEFTTLIHQPDVETTGWATHDDTLDDANWYLTGDEGTTMDCTQAQPVHLH